MSRYRTKEKKFKSELALTGYILSVALFVAWSLGPIIWSFIIAITPRNETMNSPANFFPKSPTLTNFSTLLLGKAGEMGAHFVQAMGNSLVAALATIAIGLPIMVFGAYALTRMEFVGRKLVHMALLATLVIPVFATIVPLFSMYIQLDLIDNVAGLVLIYVSASLPLIVSVLSSYFASLPKELEEAASIDGCGQFMTIIRIILPLSYPVILSSALILLISTWNQFLIPLVLAPSFETKPIAVVISEFVTKQSTNYALMNAGGLLAILPPCIIAVVFRKFLASGLTAGATRG